MPSRDTRLPSSLFWYADLLGGKLDRMICLDRGSNAYVLIVMITQRLN